MKKLRIARRQRRAAQLAWRKRNKQQGRRPRLPEDRRGSVIVVVIALLSALMFLGFVFFSLSAQEHENALYFKEASKKIEPLDFDPNDIFDCFLEQLILGAPNYKCNSVFWGGRISLLPTMYGLDGSAFNGEGTHALWFDPDGDPIGTPGDGYPVVDRNFDTTPDGGIPGTATYRNLQRPLWINLSPGALLDPTTGAPYTVGKNVAQLNLIGTDGNPTTHDDFGLPDKDVNYLSPDHEFPMLTYIGYTYAPGSPGAAQLVMIPAGHRPQLLRNRAPAANWYTDPATLPFVLRPHQLKKAVTQSGIITGINRYLPGFFTSQPNPVEGVWQNTGNYNYDCDPADFGVNNAVYLDREFPIQTDPNTGQQFVPLIGAVIFDGESKLNLNVVGNNSEYLVRPLGNTISNVPANQSLSRSNKGVSRSEINPIWALLTNPAVASPADQQPYIDYYGGWATTPVQLGNMELLSILQGRAEITAGVATQAYAGRWGEPGLVINNWNGSKGVGGFPKAGVSGAEDNGNANEGVVPAFAFNLVNPHPFDIYGVGSITGINGYHRYLPTVASGNLTFAGYKNYSFANTASPFPYQTFFGGGLTLNSANRQNIDDPEEMVTDLRFASLIQNDSPFSPAATASLQLSRTDLNQTGISSGLDNLAPYTFTQTPAAEQEEIRRRFTTISYEMKSHGANYIRPNPELPPNPTLRQWEWNSIIDTRWGLGTLAPVFPPTVGGATTSNPQPYRPETFEMLMSVARDNRIKTLARKLSVNGVVDRVADGTIRNGFVRVRPLIGHPLANLGAVPVNAATAGIPSLDPFNVNVYGNPPTLTTLQQEYFARYDRQRLCRDIYTLLYLLGGPNDTLNYLTPNPYTAAQCKEMAQFAVNLVDQMDPDDVVTMFEYDINLSDGWLSGTNSVIDDYPYPPDLTSGTKYYVYGVEEQTLAFNEGLAVFAPAVDDSTQPGSGPTDTKADHNGTEWDDMNDNSFLFFELQNVSPRPVNFANDQWQIVVRPLSWSKPYDPTQPGTSIGEEKRLTLDSSISTLFSSPVVGANSLVTFGTVGAKAPVAGVGQGSFNTSALIFPEPTFPADGIANGTNLGPARLRVDPEFVPPGTNAKPTTICPALEVNDANLNYVDLLRDVGRYRVYQSAGANLETDGSLLTSSVPNPSGAKLLDINNTTPLNFGTNDYRVELVLRRRMNPYRVQPDPLDNDQSRDNPWVVVDRFHVALQQFRLVNEQASGSDIVTQLQNLRSTSRYQALYGAPGIAGVASAVAATAGAKLDQYNPFVAASPEPDDYRANTFGLRNEDAPLRNTLWHPHFNHPYSTSADVLNVPVCGPDRLDTPLAPEEVNNPWRDLTVHMAKSVGTYAGADTQTLATTNPGITPDQVPDLRLAGVDYNFQPSIFGTKALNPNGQNYSVPLGLNNRWHRLLEFVEVPSRMNQSLELRAGQQLLGNVNGSQTLTYRDAGALNVNTLATSLNLGALLDDSSVIQVPTPPTTGQAVPLNDQGGNGPGFFGPYDWWQLFMASRDGIDDPIHTGINVPLPGVPGISNPFRPLQTAFASVASIGNTILRPNPLDVGAGNVQKRHLFELGTLGNVTSPGADQDYAFRNRLLGKVMNHTTTQSNTFIIFLQADYFQAQEVPDGFGGTVVQIGQKLPTSPGYRGFFVVDRSLAAEILTTADIPNKNSAKTFSFNPNFDWRSLIVHRQRLN